MEEPTTVRVTDRAHAALLNRWIGICEAETAVEKRAKEFDRLPGFGLAMALLQKEAAEARSLAVAENLRAVARAGIDVTLVNQISLEMGPKGELRLTVTMMDLADMASANG